MWWRDLQLCSTSQPCIRVGVGGRQGRDARARNMRELDLGRSLGGATRMRVSPRGPI